jgi:uncharacterized protein YbjQ (UPF0145 family)
MDATLLTTSTMLEGYKITKQLGLVRGITVRSRSILGNMAGGFMMIFGGRVQFIRSSAKMPEKKRCS